MATIHACLAAALLAVLAPAQGNTCQLKPFDKSCGPTLGGTHQTQGTLHVLTLQITAALPSAAGFHILGSDKIGTPIPVYGCKLLTTPLVLVPFVSDAQGRATTVLTAPSPLLGKYYIQAASVDVAAGIVQVTAGLEVECR